MTDRRKNIALFTALPEASHERRIVRGVAEQCRKYGYHVSVFAAMTHFEFKRTPYSQGEANIFTLPDYDGIDGVILDTVNLVDHQDNVIINELCDRLQRHPEIPVVALEMSAGGFPLIRNRNEEPLREMCRHVIEVHGKKDLLILTGQKGNEIAESRLAVLLDEIHRHGLEVTDEHIVYGDFWYTSGDRLAHDLLDHKISMPEAVLSVSDHMALGLIDHLRDNGVRIPEDLIVVSFDTVEEGRCSDVMLSSYDAADIVTAADAVDHIRRIIEPEGEILPYQADAKDMFNPGMSCGCEPDFRLALQTFRNAIYFTNRNYASEKVMAHMDIGMLMESYAMEDFTSSATPEECLNNIRNSAYLLHPYEHYYLCLREDWLEPVSAESGYPSRMKLALSFDESRNPDTGELGEGAVFETGQMIPALCRETPEPSVFYFSAVHFEEITLGYSVLQRSLVDTYPINVVYRSWLRFVNNALEMTRTKSQLLALSVRDSMTGLYNRRGMELRLKELLAAAEPGDSLFVAVIDMDGLKQINDTYGHQEGDFGIRLVGKAVAQSARGNEISVRAGGDEFYLLGVGRYDEAEIPGRVRDFLMHVDGISGGYRKPFIVSASMGCSIRPVDAQINISAVISQADKTMYEAKVARKKQRGKEETS